MALIDELGKLKALQDPGVLDDAEFARAKARLLDGPDTAFPPPPLAAFSSFRRSTQDRWLGGVCGGIARSSGIDSWLWRLLTVLLSLWGGAGLLVSVLLWIFVPDDSAPVSGTR